MKGKQEVINAIDGYLEAIERHASDIPYEVKTKVIQQIVRTGSIDTGAFIQAVDFHQETAEVGYRYFVDASRDPSVYYDGFVEVDHYNQPQDSILSGRFNYRDGLENSDFRPIFDEIFNEGFTR